MSEEAAKQEPPPEETDVDSILQKYENEVNDQKSGYNYSHFQNETTHDQEGDYNYSQLDTSQKKPNKEGDHVIRVRGLPWSTKEQDVRDFFDVCQNIIAIHFTYSREGRPTGEAYIELGSAGDVEIALSKNRELLGQRYIEVFLSKKDEMEYVLKRTGRRPGPDASGRKNGSDSGSVDASSDTPDPETVVRLRGLPYGSTKEDIISFFDGLEIAPDGVVFTVQHQMSSYQQSGKRSKPGEAYVRFTNKEAAERALDRHMNKIGHRYIEVFRSTVEEMERMGNESEKVFGGYGRGSTRPGPYSMPVTGGPVPLCSIPFPDFGVPPGRSRGWSEGSRYGAGRSSRQYGRGGASAYGGYYDNYYGTTGYYGGMVDEDPYGFTPPIGHMVHMRGLPFKATANDIMEFFQPLKLVNVKLLRDEHTGRASGEAEVEFSTHEDAVEAMKKDRHHIGGRYIELFLSSQPGPPSGSSPGLLRQTYGMVASPNGASIDASATMDPYGQPLVQYPGFAAYTYAQPDPTAVTMASQPPPPPPTKTEDESSSGAAYY